MGEKIPCCVGDEECITLPYCGLSLKDTTDSLISYILISPNASKLPKLEKESKILIKFSRIFQGCIVHWGIQID